MTSIARFLPNGLELKQDNQINLKGVYFENNANLFNMKINNQNIYENIITKCDYNNLDDYANQFSKEIDKIEELKIILENTSLYTNIYKHYDELLGLYYLDKINKLKIKKYNTNNLKNIVLLCYKIKIDMTPNNIFKESDMPEINKIIISLINHNHSDIPINLIDYFFNDDLKKELYKYMFRDNINIERFNYLLLIKKLSDLSLNFSDLRNSYYLTKNFNDLVIKNKIKIQSIELPVPKMNFKLFNLTRWNNLNFSLLYPNIPSTTEIYLKLCSKFLEKKKYQYDIDWTKGYVIIQWNNYKIKVNMLQYLLLEHIKVNKSLKINEIEPTLCLHKQISEHILNSLYQANLITENKETFTLNKNYSPTDDNEIINAISFFNIN